MSGVLLALVYILLRASPCIAYTVCREISKTVEAVDRQLRARSHAGDGAAEVYKYTGCFPKYRRWSTRRSVLTLKPDEVTAHIPNYRYCESFEYSG